MIMLRIVQRTGVFAALTVVGGLAGAATAEAQLASASSATLGQGGNSVATARGFASVASNPAGLGLSGNPGFSLAILPVLVSTGLDPVTLSDLKDVEGRLVSGATKEAWLSRIGVEGEQGGSVGASISAVSLSAGRVGFQLSTLVSAGMRISPGVAEAILYGNAGRTGSPSDIDFTGSSMDGFAVTTAGLSFGLPLTSERGEMALGATVTASIGHALLLAEGSTGSIQSDPVRVDIRFPTVLTSEDDAGNSGSGMGLDLGFAMRQDRLSFGATVKNAVSTFSWDEGSLRFREGTAVFEAGNNETDFDEQPLAAAPAALREAVDDQVFARTIVVGAAYDLDADVRILGDLRNRFGDGLDLGPAFHVGVGAEYRGLEVLHLRAGGAVITDGVQIGGGASLVLGPVHLSFAGARRMGDLDDATLGQFTLSFGAH